MSVKIYKYSTQKDLKLSEHFSVYEFASESRGYLYSENVLIDTDLIDMLEKVFEHFNCSKIIISSGYRTSAHDKIVGGSGSGFHCTGQAADFCCYDSNGNPIDSGRIACYLEGINCYGIGYKCGGSQYHTHADTRPFSRKWHGDESKNCLSIQSINGSTSFYDYLGIEKDTVSSEYIIGMTLSENGLNLIKTFEGLSLKACKAVATEKYYTIGYGHYGADVKEGQTISEAEALKLLKSDVKIFENAVNSVINAKISQNQFDSLVSLCYNIGIGAFQSSDLVKYLNKGNIWHGAAEFPLWRKAGSSILAGLQNRRVKELSLFAVGMDVTLTDSMNVRTGSGTSHGVKKVYQLTADGKKNATSTNTNSNAVFKSGTVITILEVKVNYTELQIDIWARCPSGWICLKQGDSIFAR